ncbi:MAG TPA: aminotransferase class V-fold PLP-dependent enzyme [Acidobacteriaceae bacterium]
MAIDVASVRADTPGCENVLHLNNAGASLPPTPVLERVKTHLDLEAAMGGYEAEDSVAEEYQGIYRSIAKMLGCAPSEIALVENATRAWDAAFYALAESFQPGDKILTASNEYVSNYLAFLQAVRQRGIEIVVVPNESGGEVSLTALEAAIRQHGERVKLIALTHVPTNGGLVQPAIAVGRIARRNHIPYLLDACQSAGQMPLDVEQLGCDMLAATGRKYLRGPRGTGFLYIRQSMLERLEPTPIDMSSAEWSAREEYKLRNDARRFEISGGSVACQLGLGVAVQYAMSVGLDNIAARVTMLAEQLRKKLGEIPGVTVRDLPGSGSQPRCGIVTFTHDAHSAGEILNRMREQKINVRVTPISSTRIDMEQRGLTAMVRASVHYYNTEEEIARFVKAVAAQ